MTTAIELAKQVIALPGIDQESDAYKSAKALIDSSTEAVRSIAEAMALEAEARATTAERWPELLKHNWFFFRDTDVNFAEFRKPNFTSATSIDEREVTFTGYEEDSSRPKEVVVALLDATGNNTTANELRAKVAELRARLGVEFDRDKSDETDGVNHRVYSTGYNAGLKFALDLLEAVK
jgi:hypothetical protein